MDWEMIEDRWVAREPIDGVSFLLDDSVQVIRGPRTGATGAVTSLLDLSPEPRYRVELEDGTRGDFARSRLLSRPCTAASEALRRLQRWYSAQCDGAWEHRFGVVIETLDNPGWLVKIDLTGTSLERRERTLIRNLDHQREWLECMVVDGQFRGAGGPHMLGRILAEFFEFAGSEL